MRPFEKKIILQLLCFAFVFVIHLKGKAQYEKCHIDDWTALKAIYEYTWGDNWDSLRNWNIVADSIRSIDCDLSTLFGTELNEDGRVNTIILNNNDLNGSIPKEIGLLTELKYLNLSKNNFVWGEKEIPTEIRNLVHLEYLNLAECNFEDFIPAELGNLINLEELIMNNNEFGRGIPAEIGNLTNLKVLDLSNNKLRGSIPIELSNLDSLEYLYLYNNELSGSMPKELGLLSNLKELILAYNELEGRIPPEFGNLYNLIDLTLSSNLLVGEIPLEIENLNKLQYLFLAFNQFEGDIPIELTKLDNLKQLSLAGNVLSGAIPIEIGDLFNVEYLWLYDNQLSGSIPSEIGNLCKLIFLHLDDNQLNGNIPKELGGLPDLQELDLSSNNLTGSIPTELTNLNNLLYLFLENNNLSGVIPKELGYLSNLKYLFLHNNQLEGSIPYELGKLTNLEYLKIINNNLSNCFDKRLNVFCFKIYNEQFIIEYPEDWGRIPDYSRVIDNGNNFDETFEEFCLDETGTCTTCHESDSLVLIELHKVANGNNWNVPWDIENELVKNWHGLGFDKNDCVKSINLSNMNINAKLTKLLEPLANLSLESLDLSNNQISGYIPSQIEKLNNIKSLKLDHNQLIGKIPHQFYNLRYLDTLRINKNQLSGCYYRSVESFLCKRSLGIDGFYYNFSNETISEGNQFDIDWETLCEGGDDKKGKCEDLLYFEIDKIDINNENSVEFEIYASFGILLDLNFSIKTSSDCDSFNVEIINPFLNEESVNVSNEVAGRLDITVNQINTDIEFNDYALLKITSCAFTTDIANIDISGNIVDRSMTIPLYQNEKNLSTIVQLTEHTLCDYSANIAITGKSKKPFTYLSINKGDTLIHSKSNFHEIIINDLNAGESYDVVIQDANGKKFSTTLLIPEKSAGCKLDTINNPPEVIDTIMIDSLINVADTPIIYPFIFELYPNPANDILQVKLHNTKKVTQYAIHIFDATGKLVQSNNLTSQNTSQSIDISKIDNGIYFVQLNRDGYSFVKKLLIK